MTKLENFEKLLDDAKKPLYPNCKIFTKISTLIKLYNLKVKFGWSEKSITELLKLIGDILPTPNEIPTSTYEAKRFCVLLEWSTRRYINVEMIVPCLGKNSLMQMYAPFVMLLFLDFEFSLIVIGYSVFIWYVNIYMCVCVLDDVYLL